MGERMTKKANANDSKGNLKIAGNCTVDDWKALEKILICGKPDNWKLAYNAFFLTRIQTRYFDPIETLIKHGGEEGEGFSIVALQCSLIEFLASTLEGKNYKHCKNDEARKKLCDHEYCNSSKLFTHFLRTESPFKKHLRPSDRANHFYDNVRCPLLHEARTKGGWRILAGEGKGPVINYEDKIIYRNRLQEKFKKFVKNYGEKLPQCKELQKGFKIKFDGLCKE
jgi:hypothetical protein